MTTGEFLDRLDGVHKAGAGHVAKCPAHPDDKPSLSVSAGADGRILLHCHAGCSAPDIVNSMGLTMSDLMPPRDMPSIADLTRGMRLKPQTPRHVVATYDYEDESGAKLYRVTRYEPKDFRQNRYDEAGNLQPTMTGARLVPYRLPQVIAAAQAGQPVFVVEGEKDVQTVERLGFTATTNSGGAKKPWLSEWSDYFKGASAVYVIADNDPPDKKLPGQHHAFEVRESMRKAGITSVAFAMPQGKDLTDWVSLGNGADELESLIANPPTWPSEWEFDGPQVEEVSDRGYTLKSIDDFPDYQAEDDNPDILIKGRWLERGGSAWWISTAGTGKSIASMQLAFCFSVGLPFAGLTPNVKPGKGLTSWIIQSEDSPSRITIDREDITAELMEQYPSIDWIKARKSIKFLTIGGKVGAAFLQALSDVLEIAKYRGELPDLLIMNPFLAYIGGPVTDGSYVTPFLRGGEINHKPTPGLQNLLETYNLGVLIYHHTPKPPSEDDIDKWMKSTFPEYQGAGSADITNWGRSFVTMMRVKNEPGMVCITAGKNGGEIGWDAVDGAPRRFLAWSHGKGITGKSRHAWRELEDDEYARVTHDSKANAQGDIDRIVSALRTSPMTVAMATEMMMSQGMSRRAFRAAWTTIVDDYKGYGLACLEAKKGRSKCWILGQFEAAKQMAFDFENGGSNDL